MERDGNDRNTVLVVDGASVTCVPLTDHLRQRGLRCEIQGTGKGALEHLKRATTDRWPRLVMIHFPPVDVDGLELLAQIRQKHPSLPIICYADLNLIGGIIFDQAERMDVRFLALPFEFPRLNASLDAGLAVAERRKSRDDGPFFGTSRHVRGTTSRYNSAPTSTDDDLPPHQTTGSLRRQTSPRPVEEQLPQAAPANPSNPPTARVARPGTSSIRRSMDTGIIRSTDRLLRTGSDRYTNPGPDTGTARIRRGVTGRVENPNRPPTAAVEAPGTASQRRVLCASCRQPFAVANRVSPYSVPCLNCGALNRIDPVA
jgi:CheY-like chemotaxis protein